MTSTESKANVERLAFEASAKIANHNPHLDNWTCEAEGFRRVAIRALAELSEAIDDGTLNAVILFRAADIVATALDCMPGAFALGREEFRERWLLAALREDES